MMNHHRHCDENYSSFDISFSPHLLFFLLIILTVAHSDHCESSTGEEKENIGPPLLHLAGYFRSTTESLQYHVFTCFRYLSGYLLWCGFEILCTFIYLAFEISGFWITMITQTKKISNPSQVQVSCKIIILITTIFCAASTPSLTMNIYLHTSDTQ